MTTPTLVRDRRAGLLDPTTGHAGVPDPGLRRSAYAARRLTLIGLHVVLATVALDHLNAIGRLLSARLLIEPMLLAAAAALAAAIAVGPGLRSSSRTSVIAGLVLVHGLTWLVAPPRPFDGALGHWLTAHLLLIALILAAPTLRHDDARRLLLLGALASLGMLTLGDAALSADARTVAGLSGRLTGVFGHPNLTGLAAALLLCLSLTGTRRRPASAAVAVLVLVLVLSLSAIVAAAAGMLAATGWRLRHIRALIVLSAVTLLLAPLLLARMAPSQLDPDWFTGRAGIWLWVTDVDTDLWFGAGTDVFSRLRGSTSSIGWFHAHNQPLMDLVTGGVVLAVATAGLLLALWRLVDSATGAALWSVVAVAASIEVPLDLTYPGARVLLLGLVIGAVPCAGAADAESLHG